FEQDVEIQSFLIKQKKAEALPEFWSGYNYSRTPIVLIEPNDYPYCGVLLGGTSPLFFSTTEPFIFKDTRWGLWAFFPDPLERYMEFPKSFITFLSQQGITHGTVIDVRSNYKNLY